MIRFIVGTLRFCVHARFLAEAGCNLDSLLQMTV
jgi:hypothetical protein